MTYSSYDDGLPYGCACEIFSTDLYRQQLAKVMNTLNIKERDFSLSILNLLSTRHRFQEFLHLQPESQSSNVDAIQKY